MWKQNDRRSLYESVEIEVISFDTIYNWLKETGNPVFVDTLGCHSYFLVFLNPVREGEIGVFTEKQLLRKNKFAPGYLDADQWEQMLELMRQLPENKRMYRRHYSTREEDIVVAVPALCRHYCALKK
ncbi:MAG: hypothetical protein IJ154_01605 [Bacteroidales bacterium]|nr:hypothetical protein [Bacteroidales bacterium]